MTDTPAEIVLPDYLNEDKIRMMLGMVPDLTRADILEMDESEVAIFDDLQEMNTSLIETTKLLQESSEQGGPSSILGFIRLFMEITKTGTNELARVTGIQRLRMISILEETVDMTPGEMTKIKEVLLPRYERWKALQDKPENAKRKAALEKKRALKKAKKTKKIDPITGMIIR